VDGSQVISVAGRQAALAAAVVFRRHFDAAAADSAIRVRIARDGRARRKKHGSKSEDGDILVHRSMINAHSNPVCLLAHVRFGSMDCQSWNGRRHPIHVICIINSIISMRFSIIVAADNLWTQAADFDCPILKSPEPLRCAGLPTGRVGQRKSAA
jgi:hypothetical protein